ncbi:MAG: AAA family ATPase, partial [Myxococcales bacterium]|nr:AAA family ATPase [Myxococcales bacterium]
MAQNVNLKNLISRLDETCKTALNEAASLCVNRKNFEVTLEHYLQALVDDPKSDLRAVFSYFEIEIGRFEKALQQELDALPTGSTRRPMFSPLLIRWLERTWMIASVNFQLTEIRSGVLMVALRENPAAYGQTRWMDIIESIPEHQLHVQLFDIIAASHEKTRAKMAAEVGAVAQRTGVSPQGLSSLGLGGSSSGGGSRPSDGSALGRYAMNFTQRAREDSIDPVFGRDREIRQMVDILARRRKNNPIIVGEAGVGKTALVEGLAVRIVAKDVPDVLKNVELIGLDMGLLQAGAGVKGEFENRLKQVIEEVKASPVPIVLFIDEAHTMIGAGNKAGGSDAANLLKPALARGELRTVAATTWSEYKKYFEKDAALSRRFQLVKVDEPDVEATTVMLRGLRSRYEESHRVIIRDDALVAASELGSRYISGRQQPDKGIDLVDTAAARVRVALTAKPADLEDAERRVETLERERDALTRDAADCAMPVEARLEELAAEIALTQLEVERLTHLWMDEKTIADKVVELRRELRAAEEREAEPPEEPAADVDAEEAAEEGAEAEPPPPTAAELRDRLHATLAELRELQGKEPLLHVEVTPEVIARVVSDWTGIPLGKMVRDQAQALLGLEREMAKR